jgi:hypothetical protein
MFRRFNLQRDARPVYRVAERILYSDIEPDLSSALQNSRRFEENIEIRVPQFLPEGTP